MFANGDHFVASRDPFEATATPSCSGPKEPPDQSLVEEGSASFYGDFYRVEAQLEPEGPKDVPLLISALAPVMLRIAGEMSNGTITWMSGLSATANHIVPRINSAAQQAGRTAPRVCVGLPIAVTDDKQGAREQAAKLFQRFHRLGQVQVF